ncbi:MAG TPA: tetratricopeptide repeat protein [Pyrinomonadaceae bacterium]|jgi:tetratricopeptide (TPR) repeat protein|nr:tetratricopeptide repeat protein [Pyrinomonadaceae bacterium]
MKRVLSSFACVLLLLTLLGRADAQRKPASAKPAAQTVKETAGRPKAPAAKGARGEDAQKSELDEIVKLDDAGHLKLSAAERVERLEAFIKDHPDSTQLLRARELLTSARAALGDERLRGGDHAAGVELFRAAVGEAPEGMSDKLFLEVVSQLPANLYVLGERDAALELARSVEARAKDNAQRLLVVASFYLGIERPEEAARVAQSALALQPDSAPAHQVLGTAYRYALRLDDAASEFARAVELDPKSAGARHTLAELRRATGKPEEALSLYREQLAADPQDATAHSGLVLALFDAGRRDEAERELPSALTGEAKDLPLLVGASYWYSAHGDGARALELAEKAVAFESRFGWAWARIAQGRALLALKRPLEAELALRAARRFGNFPTLDYELAAALAGAGLYDEAAETLSHSFTIRDGQIETRLAGRVEARAADFNELLAPERRASLSQFAPASSAVEAKMLKALFAFRLATDSGAGGEQAAAESAREFAAGDDEMRTFRNLYAAERLEHLSASAHAAAFERAEAAIGGVEAALNLPHAPIAIFADTDDVRALRQQAVETGAPLSILNVQRDVLSKVLRGRIEELAGWALYNQGQSAEAVVRLRRAVSVLPEHTQWWRAAEWRLGAALEATGGARDALAAYVRSYREQPDPTHRAVIEALYRRLNNGSTQGLEQLTGTPDVASAPAPSQLPTQASTAETTATQTNVAASAEAKAAAPESSAPASPEPTPAPTPSTTPAASTTPTAATPEPSPTETPTSTPSPAPTPSTLPSPTPPAHDAAAEASTPSKTPTPEPSQQSVPEQKPEQSQAGGVCALTISDPSVEIKSNGGSATVAVTLANYAGKGTPPINPSTPNWADIIVLAEPRAPSDGDRLRFTVTSVSGKTGAFIVSFSSPCGKQDVTVNVK